VELASAASRSSLFAFRLAGYSERAVLEMCFFQKVSWRQARSLMSADAVYNEILQ
jgi:hypothetical protein